MCVCSAVVGVLYSAGLPQCMSCAIMMHAVCYLHACSGLYHNICGVGFDCSGDDLAGLFSDILCGSLQVEHFLLLLLKTPLNYHTHHDNPPLCSFTPTYHFNVNPSPTAHTDAVGGGNILMYTQRKHFIYIKSLSLRLLMLQTKKGDNTP